MTREVGSTDENCFCHRGTELCWGEVEIVVPVVGSYAECLLCCESKDVFNNIRNTFCVYMCMMERASELGGN